VKESFALAWFGGAAERHFRARRKRQRVDEFPWSSLCVDDFDPGVVRCAQASWTEGAFFEYCSGASFAAVSRALLEANAPIDLIGMAGDFVADEMYHAELNARMAMAFGGAAPRLVNFSDLVPSCTSGLSPFDAAVELAVRICVAEALTAPILAEVARATKHPRTHAVLSQLARDEGPHAALGWLVLEWAQPQLSEAARERLAVAAEASLTSYRKERAEIASQGAFPLETAMDMARAGFTEPIRYVATLDRAMEERVWRPLERFGIFAPPPCSCETPGMRPGAAT
jgi:hypothetical protein